MAAPWVVTARLCLLDPKVLPGTRRILAFSPVIIDRHVSRYLLAFLADDLGGF